MRVVISICMLLFCSGALAQEQIVTPLFQTNLSDIEGREGLMVTVEFPPGVAGATHRHNAHTFVYVLEGSVYMQVEGGERELLQVGETFYETPADIHTVGMNASDTHSAKILVFFIKQQGEPVSMPVH